MRKAGYKKWDQIDKIEEEQLRTLLLQSENSDTLARLQYGFPDFFSEEPYTRVPVSVICQRVYETVCEKERSVLEAESARKYVWADQVLKELGIPVVWRFDNKTSEQEGIKQQLLGKPMKSGTGVFYNNREYIIARVHAHYEEWKLGKIITERIYPHEFTLIPTECVDLAS